jgi:hypothetical protein
MCSPVLLSSEREQVQQTITVPSYFTRYTIKDWKRNYVVSLENITIEQWEQWWCNTEYARGSPPSIIWSVQKKTSKCWEYIIPVARNSDGMPYCYCTICSTVLQHPSISNAGNTHLARHLASKKCQHARGTRGLGPLDAFLEPRTSQVRLAKVYYIDYYNC